LPRRYPRIRFRLSTLLLIPLLVSIVFWHFGKPQRTIRDFKEAFARGDIAAVNQMCTNARFSIDTRDWEGSLMRHFPGEPNALPNNWSDTAQNMFDDFRDSHIIAGDQSFLDWWHMRREFRFASAHTRTPPDRTSIGARWEDGKIVPGETVHMYWNYRDPITGEIVENWSQDGDHNLIFKERRFIVNGDRVTIEWW
jgi:hypothetical protein